VSETFEHGPGDRLFFGLFELRPVERLLLRHDVPVALGSRAMDILLRLIEREGEVVSPDELLDSVWRGVKVEPGALRVQVSALRKVLGEADPNGRYVSNVAGRGYCFVAPISRQAVQPAATLSPSAHDPLAAPRPPGRMIGREAVVGDLERMIATERFVTLVGPGGIGKTTVAQALIHHMAHDLAGEVVFVDLAIQLSDAGVANAVATALHMNVLGRDPVAAVAAELRSRRLLLILDSCEHVIQGAASLAEAVCKAAPQVNILATSREPLNVMGERVHRLAALETPPPSAQLSFEEACAYPAVELFVERVAASGGEIGRGSTEALLAADICRKLEGIPLAIELGAGRVEAFGLTTTLALLDSRLRLSWPGRRTAPPRQLTLSATLDWSYDLLPSDEAMLLRVLSMFVGAFTLEDAELVARDFLQAGTQKALASLVAKSLVSTENHRSPVRYRLLDATRDYARLKLEAAGELRVAAGRHASWATDVLRNQLAQLDRRPMPEWLEGFGASIQDAQSALDWSLSADGDPSFAAPLTLVAAPVWVHLGRPGECRRRIDEALRVVEPDSRDEMVLNIALVHAIMHVTSNEEVRAEVASKRAWRLAQDLGDIHAELRAIWALWNTRVGAMPKIGLAREDARLYRELASAHGDTSEQTIAERMVSVSELVGGDLAAARAASDRAQSLSRTWTTSSLVAWYDYDPVLLAGNTRVSILWMEGKPDAAVALARDNLARTEGGGRNTTRAAIIADACAALSVCLGDLLAADRDVAMLDECIARGAPGGYRTWARILRATLAARRGDPAPGRDFLSAELPPECGHPRFAYILTELALSMGEAGAEDVARDLADRLLRRIEATGERWIWSEVQRVRGELAQDAAEAESLFDAALATAQQQGARAWALRAAISLARRRRSAASELLKPLLDTFTEGADTRDHVEARAVLKECGVDLP
jgi:predicted ATPase